MYWLNMRCRRALAVDQAEIVDVDRVGHRVHAVLQRERLIVGRAPIADIFDARGFERIQRAVGFAEAGAEPAAHASVLWRFGSVSTAWRTISAAFSRGTQIEVLGIGHAVAHELVAARFRGLDDRRDRSCRPCAFSAIVVGMRRSLNTSNSRHTATRRP